MVGFCAAKIKNWWMRSSVQYFLVLRTLESGTQNDVTSCSLRHLACPHPRSIHLVALVKGITTLVNNNRSGRSITMSKMNMAANYAENLISERLGSFTFQPRDGPLRMKVISNASLSQIIRRGDHRALQTLLNNTNIVKADVAGEDFDFHSSDFLVKLFQICQLSLEFTQTKCKMLVEELNEVDRFSKITENNLTRQDELVATLRDELYHCKEALKRAEEQQSHGQGVLRVDHSMFPSQERRINLSSSSSDSPDDDDVLSMDGDSIDISTTKIKLHVVSPTHGLHIPLIVDDETCTIQTLQNKILDEHREGSSIDFEQWSLYYKDQVVQSSGTLKEYQITNDSALVILPTSSNNMSMESQLDDIKSLLNQVTSTLECQVASQESSTEQLVKRMNSCNEMLEEVLRTKTVGTTTSPCPSDTKSPSAESNIDEQSDSNSNQLEVKTPPEDRKQTENMELKIDTTAECHEWPFGLDFDTFAGLPKEINVTQNASDGGSPTPSNGTHEKASQTMESSNSPTKGDCCDCSGEEFCDECVNGSSPKSSEAVAVTYATKNNDNDEIDEHFTFSVFDTENFTAADFDYSCDKSDFESLHIGAKEPNVVADPDLQSVEISQEEFVSGLDANEDKKTKKRRILKKLAFKPNWKKLMRKKKAASIS